MSRLLLVDDHEANRSVLRRRLERRGYEVAEAADGAEAIAAFKARRPDLILMDLSMPTINGFEALVRIQAMDLGHHTPAIALTAHAVDSIRQKCADSGFDGFQTKPVDFDALVKNIENLVGAAQ